MRNIYYHTFNGSEFKSNFFFKLDYFLFSAFFFLAASIFCLMDERLVVRDRKGWERRSSADFLSLGRKARQESSRSLKSWDIEDQDLISGLPRAAMRYMARIGVSFMYGGWPWEQWIQTVKQSKWG